VETFGNQITKQLRVEYDLNIEHFATGRRKNAKSGLHIVVKVQLACSWKTYWQFFCQVTSTSLSGIVWLQPLKPIGQNLRSHDLAGRNVSSSSKAHTGQDRAASANPAIFSDDNWTTLISALRSFALLHTPNSH
jgi:hypothetical protein